MGINWSYLYLLTVFFFGLNLTTSAQKDTNATYSWNGRIIRYYKIEKKNTLYGISKQFDVPQDTLIALNPELANGLKTGNVIKIPVGFLKKDLPKSADKPTAQEHVVKAKETLFGISSAYGLTVDELKALNPNLEGGLKPGMILNLTSRSDGKTVKSSDKGGKPKKVKEEIPAKPETENESASKPVKCKTRTVNQPHEIFNLAILVPLYISETGEFNPKGKIGLDFYSGARLAFDSLENLGLKLNVFVYDTQNDSTVIKEILEKPEFKKMDLIIGPLYTSAFRNVSHFAMKHGIPAISPFSQSSAILEDYPQVCKVTPDSKVLADQLARYLVKKKQGATFILVKNSNNKDEELTATFRSVLADSASFPGHLFKEIAYSGISDLINKLDEKQNYYLFFPSTVQIQVIDFVSKLNNNRAGRKITLVGLNEWNAYENIEYDYLNNLNFTYATPTFQDNYSVVSKKFQEQFKEKFKGVPSMYAYQGFDVAFYFSSLLDTYGKGFITCLEKAQPFCGFNSCYSFLQKGEGNGFENSFVNVLQLDDFELTRLNKP
jgi:LysM repeat protein